MKRLLILLMLASLAFGHDYTLYHPNVLAPKIIELDPPQTHTFCAQDVPCATTANNTHSGTETFKNINTKLYADQFSGVDSCAKIAAAIAALPAAGGIVDATGFGPGLQDCSTSNATLNLGTAPIKLIVGPAQYFLGGSSANPVVCFNSDNAIEGPFMDALLATVAGFRTATAANEVLAPCTPGAATPTRFFRASGLSFANTNALTTAAVVDFTNTQDSELEQVAVNHACGSGDLILVQTTAADGNVAYFNEFHNVQLQGTCSPTASSGNGYNFVGQPNDNKIFGGVIANTKNSITMNGTGANFLIGLWVFGTSIQQCSNAMFNVVQQVGYFNWFGGRLESTVACNIWSVGATGTSKLAVYNPIVSGVGVSYGTDQGVASWVAYEGGGAGSGAAFLAGGVNGFQGPWIRTGTANVAASGLVRVATTDVLGAFRNAANTGDVTIQKNGSDTVQIVGGCIAASSTNALCSSTGTGNTVVMQATPLINSPTITEPNLLISPLVPTIAAAGCGGAAAAISVNNGTAAFKINVGTTPGSACTFTMPAATTGWNVTCVDITTQSTSVFLQKQTGVESTTSVTITNFNDVAVATAFTASDILKCIATAD